MQPIETGESLLQNVWDIPGCLVVLFGPMFLTLLFPAVLLFRNQNQSAPYRWFYTYLVVIGGLSVHIILVSIAIAMLAYFFNNFGVFRSYYALKGSNTEDMYRTLIETQFYLGACGFVCMFPVGGTIKSAVFNIIDGTRSMWVALVLVVPTVFVGLAFLLLGTST